MGHAVEPLIDGAGDVALTRHADLGEGLQPPLELGQLARMRLGLAPPPAHMHDQRDGERNQRQDGKPCQHKQNKDRIERDAPDLKRLHGHGENLYPDSFL